MIPVRIEVAAAQYLKDKKRTVLTVDVRKSGGG